MNVVDILMKDKQRDYDISGVYITPTPVIMDSDEDFASKDEGGTIDNVTGRQLSAGAEIAPTNWQGFPMKKNLEKVQTLRLY